VNQTKSSETTMGSLCDTFDHVMRTLQTSEGRKRAIKAMDLTFPTLQNFLT
jgi:hypothetical protein